MGIPSRQKKGKMWRTRKWHKNLEKLGNPLLNNKRMQIQSWTWILFVEYPRMNMSGGISLLSYLSFSSLNLSYFTKKKHGKDTEHKEYLKKSYISCSIIKLHWLHWFTVPGDVWSLVLILCHYFTDSKWLLSSLTLIFIVFSSKRYRRHKPFLSKPTTCYKTVEENFKLHVIFIGKLSVLF